MDRIDKQILEILQQNGRITNSELAKQINMSPPPTLERVKKLEQKGYIKKYVAILNPEKIDKGSFIFVEITLSRHGSQNVLDFMEAAKSVDEILECHHITGDADFLLKIAVKNIPAYEELVLKSLTNLPNVQHLKSLVVLSTIKNETSYKIDKDHENQR